MARKARRLTASAKNVRQRVVPVCRPSSRTLARHKSGALRQSRALQTATTL
jgi:hypothetical protein